MIYTTSVFQIEPLSALGASHFAVVVRKNFIPAGKQFPCFHTQCFGYSCQYGVRGRVNLLHECTSRYPHLLRKLLLGISLLLNQFLDSMFHLSVFFICTKIHLFARNVGNILYIFSRQNKKCVGKHKKRTKSVGKWVWNRYFCVSPTGGLPTGII